MLLPMRCSRYCRLAVLSHSNHSIMSWVSIASCCIAASPSLEYHAGSWSDSYSLHSNMVCE